MKRTSFAAIFAMVLLPFVMHAAAAQAVPSYDLRDITVGMPVGDLPNEGYVNLTCAKDPGRKLATWSAWRDCPADEQARHAVRFDFDPETSQDGTKVAGHPVLLTVLVDDKGTVTGLTIETDPKARLYIRKKAFLLGNQVKSRYGAEGWDCREQQPTANEQPVGGVFLREVCRKTVPGRMVTVERELFRKPDQDAKSFVDQTLVRITKQTNQANSCLASPAKHMRVELAIAGHGELPEMQVAAGSAAMIILSGRTRMSWTAPKIVEVAVGMEINMYACASRQAAQRKS